MNGELVVHNHIEITESLVKLYVFLAQALDRCLNEGHTPNLSGAGASIAPRLNTCRDDGDSFGKPRGQG